MNDPMDYVFLDETGWPWRVAEFSGSLWIFSWNANQRWVPLRPYQYDNDTWTCIVRRLPPEQARLYHDLHGRHS
jgi:hypothetical protein